LRIEHREQVRDEALLRVGSLLVGSSGASVTAQVHADHGAHFRERLQISQAAPDRTREHRAVQQDQWWSGARDVIAQVDAITGGKDHWHVSSLPWPRHAGCMAYDGLLRSAWSGLRSRQGSGRLIFGVTTLLVGCCCSPLTPHGGGGPALTSAGPPSPCGSCLGEDSGHRAAEISSRMRLKVAEGRITASALTGSGR